MNLKRNARVANFEARSVALIASWTLASAALAQNVPSPNPVRNGRVVVTELHNQQATDAGRVAGIGSRLDVQA